MRGDHWVVLSTINAVADEVNIQDSVYETLDNVTIQVIHSMFQASTRSNQLQIIQVQKQKGGKDCGLFSIINDQAAMRPHLIQCFKKHTLKPFPTK